MLGKVFGFGPEAVQFQKPLGIRDSCVWLLVGMVRGSFSWGLLCSSLLAIHVLFSYLGLEWATQKGTT